MPDLSPSTTATVPTRKGVWISAAGLSGTILGEPEDRKAAIEIVHKAIDGGVTFFDNC